MDSASPAQNQGFPAAYRNPIDNSDPQSHQRMMQSIQQMTAGREPTNSNVVGSFPAQSVHQSAQQDLARQAALVQQKQLQGSQLPSFMQNLGQCIKHRLARKLKAHNATYFNFASKNTSLTLFYNIKTVNARKIIDHSIFRIQRRDCKHPTN